jgi:iron complex outermembrane recepter protein
MKKVLFMLLSIYFMEASNMIAQTYVIGKIVNSENFPLANANVLVQNSYTSSASDGSFKIRVFGIDSVVLKISYMGFNTFSKLLDPSLSEIDLGTIKMIPSLIFTEEVNIVSTRSLRNTPVTATNLSKDDIRRNNTGQDLPYIMNLTPSMVASSDAGNGIGYTNLRLRGSDITRINVAINGVPVNDPESNAVFFVNIPDLASSTESIQIQRGVGTSANGAGAFGGSINIQTNNINIKPSAEASIFYGSYNSKKLMASVNTGLLSNKWLIEARLSKISSDGYIDRASANLQSYYLAGAYLGKKTTVKLVHFNGKEVTYQSWNGTPQSRIEGNTIQMQEHAANNSYSDEQTLNLLNAGRTFNYYQYKNQVDNYGQANYQLIWNQYLSENLKFNLVGHYTKGKGFFEEYKSGESLANYGFIADSIFPAETDLVRRRWLDNDFYGAVYFLNYTKNKLDITLGGSINQYDGYHFGEIIWAQFLGNLNTEQRYYFNQSKKLDVNNYVRANYKLLEKTNFYVDLQYRKIDYKGSGTDNNLQTIKFEETYNFINPKLGLSYSIGQNNTLYTSYAKAQHEPIRSDFTDNTSATLPLPETLNNIEFGYKRNNQKYTASVNVYLMNYKNQLVPTGALNDVGAPLRKNVDQSYRRGIEFEMGWSISKLFSFNGNIALSENKIENFIEIFNNTLADYSLLETENNYSKTDIAFSPKLIAGGEIKLTPLRQFSIGFVSKYVGAQFLDNTSNSNRAIDAYFTEDVRFWFTPKLKLLAGFEAMFQINNLFNTLYESNGYTYSYSYQYLENEIKTKAVTENFYYPQAEINYMMGVNIKF